MRIVLLAGFGKATAANVKHTSIIGDLGYFGNLILPLFGVTIALSSRIQGGRL